ncbi:MAG: Na+/H+ antiporter subunit A [Mycobacteriaceae bacterium]
MLTILLAHAVAAVVAPLAVSVMGRRAFYPLALAPLGSLIWVATHWPSDDRSVSTVDLSWIPLLSMNINLRFDSLSAILSILVLGIGTTILVYCASYFSNQEPRLGAFAAYLVAFAGAMFGLIVSDNMLLLYTFWELTTVLSFLLVGHYAERAASRRSANQALLVTTAGGLFMLVGIILLGSNGGSYLLSELLSHPPTGISTSIAIALILIGALSKSAIVPLHFWLPGAMAAPTPVSAYLHAAAMVKAGIFLVARLAPGFADIPFWRPTVICLGLTSMILAGWRANREHDLKLILAFGTVSQLGFLLVLVGTGSAEVMLAGLTMMVAHAFFKATLFMVVGVIDHSTGTRDIRKLAGLAKRAPLLAGAAALASASMAGLPPLFGFIGKEAAFDTISNTTVFHPVFGFLTLIGMVLGSILTVAYSLRFFFGAFASKGFTRPSKRVQKMSRPSLAFIFPPLLLALSGLGLGLGAPLCDQLLAIYPQSFGPPNSSYHLKLWHGLGLPLILTIFVMSVGVLVFFQRKKMIRIRFSQPLLGSADRHYDLLLRRLNMVALRTTSLTQRGSLPLTQATILATLIFTPIIALIAGQHPKIDVHLWDSPLEPVIGMLMISAAIATTVMRNRLASVLLVGSAGYGCGLIFALYGAPDLALTQFLVETLTLVIFVLVLRKFPPETEDRHATGFRFGRAILATLVGFSITILAIYAINARTAQPISLLLPDAATQQANASNIVNALLVDIRAWDTLGEISVLLVAATGVASLVFRTRRFGSAPRVSDALEPTANDHMVITHEDSSPTPKHFSHSDVTWLRGSELRDPQHRSLILETTTRLVFPTIMVLSVYFFFAGHNAPGGGFAGGLTAGLALVLRYLAGGRYELGETLPLDAGKILGVGLTLSAGTAITSIFLGVPVLSSATYAFTLPLIGSFKIVTSLFFDLGVYLIVIGVILDILRSLGARLDLDTEVTKP